MDIQHRTPINQHMWNEDVKLSARFIRRTGYRIPSYDGSASEQIVATIVPTGTKAVILFVTVNVNMNIICYLLDAGTRHCSTPKLLGAEGLEATSCDTR